MQNTNNKQVQQSTPNENQSATAQVGNSTMQSLVSRFGESGSPSVSSVESTGSSSELDNNDQQSKTSSIQAFRTEATVAPPHQAPTQQQLAHAASVMESINLREFFDKHEHSIRFPDKLMLMLLHIEKEFSKEGKLHDAPVVWALDGRLFVIRDKEHFDRRWLPMFFIKTKFASFTRKLYRWGFRQVSLGGARTQCIAFCNGNFQRNNKTLLKHMRCVTTRTKKVERARREREAQNNPNIEASPSVGSTSPPPCVLSQEDIAKTRELLDRLSKQSEQHQAASSLPNINASSPSRAAVASLPNFTVSFPTASPHTSSNAVDLLQNAYGLLLQNANTASASPTHHGMDRQHHQAHTQVQQPTHSNIQQQAHAQQNGSQTMMQLLLNFMQHQQNQP